MDNFLTNLNIHLQDAWHLLTSWFGEHAVNILVILLGAWIVRHFSVKIINQILRRTVRSDLYPTKADRERRIKTLNLLTNAAVRVAVYLVAALLVIGEINPSYTAALFTSAGLIGIALGFGAQNLIKDFVSGFFIISENQYRIGDVIEISGVSGTVEDVTIRTTVLRDLDGNLHHVPNGTITVTTNKTIGFSRINEDITVDPKTDIKELEHIINHVGEEVAALPDFKDSIIEAPHFARVKGYAPNGLVIKVLGKTTPGNQWQISSEFYKLLKQAFDRHSIKVASQSVTLMNHAKK